MKKLCKATNEEFEIPVEDQAFYERMGVGVPDYSPIERQRRRIAFRNFRHLYHRECSVTGNRLISMYDENVPFPVYGNEQWWTDTWSATDFGLEVNFDEPFFEQYKRLMQKVPRFAIMNLQSDGCEYSNFAFESKACYLVFGCVRNEDCFYGHIVWDSKDCLDTLYAFRCEWCSNSTDIVDCYDVHYSTESTNCRESYFLHDCQACNNCFGCYNLRNRSYCFFNEQCTKEEYLANLKRVFPLTREGVQQTYDWLNAMKKTSAVYPESFQLNNEDVSGNHIYESKQVLNSYDTKKGEDCRYCYTTIGLFGCYDISFTGGQSRFCVDSLTLFNSERVRHSHLISNSSDIEYSEICYSSSNLFGCIGMRGSSYCILNKQYTKEEFEKLRSRLVQHMKDTGEWGNFIPIDLSPFAYNEAIVNEYHPLEREAAISMGLKWKHEEIEIQSSGGEIKIAPEFPQDPATVQGVWNCAATKKKFKIIKKEFDFYRRMNLPLPELCPDERHDRRMAARGIRGQRSRECSTCSKPILASLHGGDPKRVCCNKCYREALS